MRVAGQAANSANADAVIRRYLSLAEATEGRPPRLVVFWPSAQMNKYQALLYKEAGANGFTTLGVRDLAELDAISWPGEIVLHCHWFGGLLATAADETTARANVDLAFEQIRRFRARTGAKLVWTAHNLLPHNHLYPALSLELRRRTVELSDAVHLMSEAHRALLENAYGVDLPDTIVVPHMTYAGVYPNYVSREAARLMLDLPLDASVLLFFGSLQPYKGLDRLIAAFKGLPAAKRRRARLLVAGIPSHAGAVAELVEAAQSCPEITVRAQAIADEDVQIYFAAADLLVLPYDDSLNSGAALLGATFGIRVLGPRSPAFTSLADLGVDTFDGDLGRWLGDFIGRGARPSDGDPAAAAALHPTRVSQAFFSAVNRLFEEPAAANLSSSSEARTLASCGS